MACKYFYGFCVGVTRPTQNPAFTGRSISSLGRVPIEILSAKRRITWAVFLFMAEFQMEPPAPNAISYDTRPAAY